MPKPNFNPKSAVAVGSIRNETQFNISRCCTAKLQFKKGNLPLVLGAATFNGSVLNFRPLLRKRKDYQYGFKVWCWRYSSLGCDEICQTRTGTTDDQPAVETTQTRTIDNQPAIKNTRVKDTKVKETKVLNRSTLRRFLLITLNHFERGNRYLVTAEEIISRITKQFACRSIIICTENHGEVGYHKHIGVWNETASKNTMRSVIRKAFPEFEGRQCHISTHRVWETVCQYLLKEDKTPVVWGEESLEKVMERADFEKVRSYKQRNKMHFTAPKTEKTRKILEKRGKIVATNAEVLQRLSTKHTWEEVLKDEVLGSRCVTNYQNIYRIFLDLKLLILQRSLPTPIKVFFFPFIQAYCINRVYICSFCLIALFGCFLSFLNNECREIDISSILKEFNEDFFILLALEFDFITSTWDFPEPPLPILDTNEPLNMAGTNTNLNFQICVGVAVFISIVVSIFLTNR